MADHIQGIPLLIFEPPHIPEGLLWNSGLEAILEIRQPTFGTREILRGT